jgi:hypothetical protein
MQVVSLATLLLFFAIASHAVRVYHKGNTKLPVTGTEAKEKDFGPLEDRKFIPME